MKPVFLLLLSFLVVPAFAEDPQPFAIWIPKGWKLIVYKAGDLNRDGLDDAVLVLEETNPAHFKKNSESLGVEILNLNPRRLVILLNTANGFEEVFSRDNLLPSQNEEDMACLADPLESGGVSITRGNLVIELKKWSSCGGYGVTHEKFSFRLEDMRFRLIGYDYSEFSRSTGEQSELSINYLTGKKKITEGLNTFKSSKPKVVWEHIPAQRHFFLDKLSLACDSIDLKPTNDWCQ